jgi:hypothetical protein
MLIKERSMVQITLRVSEEMQEMLKYEAMRLKKSQNEIVTETLRARFSKNQAALERIKSAVVAGRAQGRRSLTKSLQLTEKAAVLDDAEGLGVIRVTKRKARR